MEKDDESHIDRVWEIIEKTGICMMVTRFAGGLHARPLEARPDRDIETIWFLTDVRGLKDDEVEANPNVCLTFVYPKREGLAAFPRGLEGSAHAKASRCVDFDRLTFCGIHRPIGIVRNPARSRCRPARGRSPATSRCPKASRPCTPLRTNARNA